MRRQIESAGLLVLEWRKLREGVVASGRRDAFAIQGARFLLAASQPC